MFDQFNHRFGDFSALPQGSSSSELPAVTAKTLQDPTYEPRPRHWIDPVEVQSRIPDHWHFQWLLAWRDITNAASERTTRMAILPRVGVGDTANLIFPWNHNVKACLFLVGCLNSFAFDFVSRQRVGGLHLSGTILRQLPVPSWESVAQLWRDAVCPRVLELSATSWALESLVRDAGYGDAPFKWELERRFVLQCEIDAALLHLYEISRGEAAYILDTFNLVERADLQGHGEYRTKLQILESYDRFQHALDSGSPYRSQISTAPADPSVAHPVTTRPATIPAPHPLTVEIPASPTIMPALDAAQDAAVYVWAVLQAAGGSIDRRRLARAFVLRSQPALLTSFAPRDLQTVACSWAARVGDRSVAAGTLATALSVLAGRDGIRLTTNASGQSVVTTSSHTPTEDRIDEWFRFEARLVLRVLAAVPPARIQDIDAAIPDADRVVLQSVGVA